MRHVFMHSTKIKVIEGSRNSDRSQTDPFGSGLMFYVSLNVNDSQVNCETKDTNIAAALDKGQQVKFEGRISRRVFDSLRVGECRFERTTISEKNRAKIF